LSSEDKNKLKKKKRKSASGKKDSQLVIRINKLERDLFLDICKEIDTSAAREIRHFIRDFIDEHKEDE